MFDSLDLAQAAAVVGPVLVAVGLVHNWLAERRQAKAANDAVLREHFVRLWEIRVDAYTTIAEWALSLRDVLSRGAGTISSADVPRLSHESLSGALVCGDFEVYRNAFFLHGQLSALLEEPGRSVFGTLDEEARAEFFNDIANDAWNLLMLIRGYAIVLPQWREPLPAPDPSLESADFLQAEAPPPRSH